MGGEVLSAWGTGDFVQLVVFVVARDATAQAKGGAIGQKFAKEPILGIVELTEDEEVRMLLEEADVVLDVGPDGEDAAFELHSIEDGGVRVFKGGVVGEEEDAAEGLG